MLGVVGIVIGGLLALTGFIVGTLKVPNSQAFKITRIAGGENLDDIILRYIKFKRKNATDVENTSLKFFFTYIY